MPAWSKKRARQHALRRLASIDASLVQIARHWDELDQTVIYEIDEVRAQLDEVRAAMAASIEIEEDA